MQLKQGTLLQGGKYRIEEVLGQGGFGITYLAIQEILDRKVAIKEFFYKEYCERDTDTNTITLGTQSNKATVEKFLKKFIKEARTISTLHHPYIIQIYDIFRENNTAYYVMEYIDGKSLGDIVKAKGALPEHEAVDIIIKTATALEYIHAKNINHLDVKPNNIMLRNNEEKIVLIDFGVAKQYDETTKEGTTTTPVGISHGYSPSEQYKRNGVSSFSPESDIYSLGATLFKLVTGITPPEAIEVAQDGLPAMPSSISAACQTAIKKCMMLNKADRPHNIAQFLDLLKSKPKEQEIQVKIVKEDTVISEPIVEIVNPNIQKNSLKQKESSSSEKEKTKKKSIWKISVILIFVCLAVAGYFLLPSSPNSNHGIAQQKQSVAHLRKNVVSYEYKDASNKLVYYWTGSIFDGCKPSGWGTATYPSNDKDSRKNYVGYMKDGLRDGKHGTLTYTNGNVYKGSFSNDELSSGRLDLITDGMYFSGTFKNNNPYNGKWYYTNGKIYSTVTNGVEK